mmetsp:Transcript_21697/g.26107  ORF Transcript_21697/g.26107 Transcript_21697/m.26107 type:complete len:529 (-) Transcript_21697:3776-5362(-)
MMNVACSEDANVTESNVQQSVQANVISREVRDLIWKLFKQKADQWKTPKGELRLPKENKDEDLDKLIRQHALRRNQVSRQLLHYKKTERPDLVAITVSDSQEKIIENIKCRVGGVDAVVECVLDEFSKSLFCTDSSLKGGDDRKKMLDSCVDEVNKLLDELINAYIEAAAQCSATSWRSSSAMINKMAVARSNIQRRFRSTFNENATISTAMIPFFDEDEFSYSFRGAHLFANLEETAYDTFTQLLADHERPDLSPPSPLPEPDVNDDRAGLVYYLGGWGCFVVKRAIWKRRNIAHTDGFWQAWLQHNQINIEEAISSELPYELTQLRAQRKETAAVGNRAQLVEYASRPVFNFFWAVEATYSALLTTVNFLAYGSDLVRRIHEVISKHKPTVDLFVKTLPRSEDADMDSLESQATEMMCFLLDAYHKMRGRDFVKTMMGNLGSQEKKRAGTLRDKLAIMSDAAADAAKVKKRVRAAEEKCESNKQVSPAVENIDLLHEALSKEELEATKINMESDDDDDDDDDDDQL